MTTIDQIVLYTDGTNIHRLAMSMYCTLSENDSNCSSAFEGVDISITAVQATYAVFVILVTVPMNILVIAAFIRSRHLLEKSFTLIISFLVSNTVTCLFLSGQVFVTTVMRAWMIGYWGCQVFAFISIVGTYSRYIAVGFLALDRFCHVFFPFTYERLENKAIVLFQIFTWGFSIFIPCVLYIFSGLGFNKSYPACSYSIDLKTSNMSFLAVFIVIAVIFDTVLPIILYTAMYCKARKIARSQPVIAQGGSTARTNSRNITYGLLILTYGLQCGTYVVKYGILPYCKLSHGVVAALFYVASSLCQSSMIADLCIILRNRYDRKIFLDFIRKDLKKLVCGEDKLIIKRSTARVVVVSA